MKLSWLAADPELSEGGSASSRQRTLTYAAFFLFYFSVLLVEWAVAGSTASRQSFLVVFAGCTLAATAYTLLRHHRLRLGSWVIVVGGLGLNVLISRAFQRPISLALFALPVLWAGLLLGPAPSLLTAITAAGAMIWLTDYAVRATTGWYWIAFISACFMISVVTRQVLQLADYWEHELTVRQRELIAELRRHQGELNRTLKALDEAFVALKRSNDELTVARQEAERARAVKEQFAANVSHELRTPLNLIVGFAEMMYLAPESYKGVGWTPDLESDIGEMYRASRHLQSLVNDILDLSRIDAARLPMYRELADVRTIIGEAVETMLPLFRQRGLNYELIWPEAPPVQLFVDRTRIRQVMLNLLNNALRFTDTGTITVKMAQTSEAVTVSVHDTGVGIRQDQLEYVFESFSQADAGLRRRGGAGLGLAVSRQFVQLHGGRMWAESEVDVGSTFHFSLPLPGTVPQTVTLQYTPDLRRADLGSAPVIVVDPDPSIAEMLSRYLGNRRTLTAEDVAEAEGMIAAEHPLAIIVNQLPDAPQHTWLGALGPASARYAVPILRCSIPSPSWLRQSTGLDDCLTKPVSRESLKRMVVKYCPQPGVVLVVDDDPGFVNLMARMLGTLGVARQVLLAYSGAEALRLAREMTPDLVLLDLLMPEVDGFQVLDGLRSEAKTRAARVVAVTATTYAEEALLRRGGYMTLSQMKGISTGAITELLNATFQIVHPDYDEARGAPSAPAGRASPATAGVAGEVQPESTASRV